jgi:hypothetical protein
MEGASFDFRLKTPASICILGPSQCGKTHLVLDIIANRQHYFDRPISRVVYVYYKLNDRLQKLARDHDIHLVSSITEGDKLITESCLLVLDDQLEELKNRQVNAIVTDYFIRKVHHHNFNVILTLQRAFTAETKTVLDNFRYAVYFDSPRYRSVITHVAKNFAPKNIKYVQEAFKKATEYPHGYLLFDFANDTPDCYRLRSKIYPSGDDMFIFTAE